MERIVENLFEACLMNLPIVLLVGVVLCIVLIVLQTRTKLKGYLYLSILTMIILFPLVIITSALSVSDYMSFTTTFISIFLFVEAIPILFFLYSIYVAIKGRRGRK